MVGKNGGPTDIILTVGDPQACVSGDTQGLVEQTVARCLWLVPAASSDPALFSSSGQKLTASSATWPWFCYR